MELTPSLKTTPIKGLYNTVLIGAVTKISSARGDYATSVHKKFKQLISNKKALKIVNFFFIIKLKLKKKMLGFKR